jgi:hypothetical protein
MGSSERNLLMGEKEVNIQRLVQEVTTNWYDTEGSEFVNSRLDFSLKEVMNYITKNKLQQKFIDPPFDFTDRGAYLDKVNPFTYEVFNSERGGKHWLKKFTNLDKAIEYKLILLLRMAGSKFNDE